MNPLFVLRQLDRSFERLVALIATESSDLVVDSEDVVFQSLAGCEGVPAKVTLNGPGLGVRVFDVTLKNCLIDKF